MQITKHYFNIGYFLGYAILKPQILRDADSIETRPHVRYWNMQMH